jgi:hypothetical protein
MAMRTCLALIVLMLISQPVASRGETIDECGLLLQFDDCVVFWASTSGEFYLPENVGDFEPTALAHVSGEVFEVDSLCGDLEVSYAIADNEIRECVPVDHGCGIVTEPPTGRCWLWVSEELGVWNLPDLEGFDYGDTVRVQGILVRGCDTCGLAEGCVWSGTYGPCPITALRQVTWGRFKSVYAD